LPAGCRVPRTACVSRKEAPTGGKSRSCSAVLPARACSFVDALVFREELHNFTVAVPAAPPQCVLSSARASSAVSPQCSARNCTTDRHPTSQLRHSAKLSSARASSGVSSQWSARNCTIARWPKKQLHRSGWLSPASSAMSPQCSARNCTAARWPLSQLRRSAWLFFARASSREPPVFRKQLHHCQVAPLTRLLQRAQAAAGAHPLPKRRHRH